MKPFGILIAIVSVVIATVLTAVSYKTGETPLEWGKSWIHGQSLGPTATSQYTETYPWLDRSDTKMVHPKGLPILMYHKIGDDKDNDAVIREDLFRQQMHYLKEHGYHPITMEELYDYVVNNKPVPEKPVVLTFDDGYADTYTVVYPLLKELGFPATVFVNPGDVGTRLTWEQLKDMKDHGMTISNHGYLHKEMGEMTEEQQRDNMEKGQEGLAQHLDLGDNKWFCFPYGSMNQTSEKLAKEEGFKLALSMKSGWAHAGDDPFNLKRVWIGNAVDLKHFEERLTTEHYSDL